MPVQPINDYVVGSVRKFLDALGSDRCPEQRHSRFFRNR